MLIVTLALSVLLFIQYENMQNEDLEANILLEKNDNYQDENISNYSEEQFNVIEKYGKPDEFIINLNYNDEPRYEVWKYVSLGKIFIFEGGKYISSTDYDFNIPKEIYLRAKISPKDVYNLKTINDLNSLLEVEPTATDEIDQELLKNTVYFDYGNVISAATTDDNLIFIKTQTFTIGD